jgi:Leucine-rich repeat (LRR) protein
MIELKQLKTLDLRHNLIRELDYSMNKCCSLVELLLSHNEIKVVPCLS